jgi:hypothetical protein
MNADNWFDDLPVIGKLPPEEAAAKLREVGEDELADAIEAAQRKVTTASTTFGILEDLLPFLPKPWLYPSHVFGYSPPAMLDSTENCAIAFLRFPTVRSRFLSHC